jgi:hypothetical protein
MGPSLLTLPAHARRLQPCDPRATAAAAPKRPRAVGQRSLHHARCGPPACRGHRPRRGNNGLDIQKTLGVLSLNILWAWTLRVDINEVGAKTPKTNSLVCLVLTEDYLLICLGHRLLGGGLQSRRWPPPAVARTGPLPPLLDRCRYVYVYMWCVCVGAHCFTKLNLDRSALTARHGRVAGWRAGWTTAGWQKDPAATVQPSPSANGRPPTASNFLNW